MASHDVCDQWLEDFHQDTKFLGDRCLGLDSWGPQATPDWQADAKKKRVKLAYSPEDCTDLCAVTDDGLGWEVKKRMVAYYKADLESSAERLEVWKGKNGGVKVPERRLLFVKWLADAWEDFTTNHPEMIKNAFKRCGTFNNIEGREKHLVKIRRAPHYKAPAKDSEPAVIPKKKRKRNVNPAASALHAKRKKL